MNSAEIKDKIADINAELIKQKLVFGSDQSTENFNRCIELIQERSKLEDKWMQAVIREGKEGFQ